MEVGKMKVALWWDRNIATIEKLRDGKFLVEFPYGKHWRLLDNYDAAFEFAAEEIPKELWKNIRITIPVFESWPEWVTKREVE
jgi:hypothetical protein